MEYQELSTLLSYCIYYNANKQAEKKSLREEQLQNNLDKKQFKADRNTMLTTNTASAKKHKIDSQTRLNVENATSYGNAAEKSC